MIAADHLQLSERPASTVARLEELRNLASSVTAPAVADRSDTLKPPLESQAGISTLELRFDNEEAALAHCHQSRRLGGSARISVQCSGPRRSSPRCISLPPLTLIGVVGVTVHGRSYPLLDKLTMSVLRSWLRSSPFAVWRERSACWTPRPSRAFEAKLTL
jgi:hypothetical protein